MMKVGNYFNNISFHFGINKMNYKDDLRRGDIFFKIILIVIILSLIYIVINEETRHDTIKLLRTSRTSYIWSK